MRRDPARSPFNILANQPPVITNGASQTLNNIKTNVSVQLNGTATDPDNAAPSANQTLSYSWSQVDGAGDPHRRCSTPTG